MLAILLANLNSFFFYTLPPLQFFSLSYHDVYGFSDLNKSMEVIILKTPIIKTRQNLPQLGVTQLFHGNKHFHGLRLQPVNGHCTRVCASAIRDSVVVGCQRQSPLQPTVDQ